MFRFIKFLIVLVAVVVGSNTSQIAEADTTTHLRMTPGKVVIKEPVKPGKEIYLYRYYINNASKEDRLVELSSTGNLVVKEESVTIKPQEKYYFDVHLKVPYGEEDLDRSDYVIAKTDHAENDSVKLAAKVEYKVVDLKTTILTDSIWYFVGIFALLLLFLILVIKRRKKKRESLLHIEEAEGQENQDELEEEKGEDEKNKE